MTYICKTDLGNLQVPLFGRESKLQVNVLVAFRLFGSSCKERLFVVEENIM